MIIMYILCKKPGKIYCYVTFNLRFFKNQFRYANTTVLDNVYQTQHILFILEIELKIGYKLLGDYFSFRF